MDYYLRVRLFSFVALPLHDGTILCWHSGHIYPERVTLHSQEGDYPGSRVVDVRRIFSRAFPSLFLCPSMSNHNDRVAQSGQRLNMLFGKIRVLENNVLVGGYFR